MSDVNAFFTNLSDALQFFERETGQRDAFLKWIQDGKGGWSMPEVEQFIKNPLDVAKQWGFPVAPKGYKQDVVKTAQPDIPPPPKQEDAHSRFLRFNANEYDRLVSLATMQGADWKAIDVEINQTLSRYGLLIGDFEETVKRRVREDSEAKRNLIALQAQVLEGQTETSEIRKTLEGLIQINESNQLGLGQQIAQILTTLSKLENANTDIELQTLKSELSAQQTQLEKLSKSVQSNSAISIEVQNLGVVVQMMNGAINRKTTEIEKKLFDLNESLLSKTEMLADGVEFAQSGVSGLNLKLEDLRQNFNLFSNDDDEWFIPNVVLQSEYNQAVLGSIDDRVALVQKVANYDATMAQNLKVSLGLGEPVEQGAKNILSSLAPIAGVLALLGVAK